MRFENLKGIEFYTHKSNRTKVFAEYTIDSDDGVLPDVRKLVDIDMPEFASYLRLVVIPNLKSTATASEIILDIHDYVNVYGCPDNIKTRVRIAGELRDSAIEYALYDNYQRYVSVDANGWSLTSIPFYKFIPCNMSTNQVEPKKSNENLIDLLMPYLNTDKNTALLLITWIVQAFCEGDHHALLISAQSGCGKSVLTEILREIIDPAKTNISALNTRGDSLLTALTNSYLVAFDNTRELSVDDSDKLCIAVTGGTYSKREAYSTNTNAVFDLHNTVILNGIDIMPSESDFAQRCLLIKLKQIKDEKRLLKYDIKKRFNDDLPYILGAIFDTISRAMGIINSIKIVEKSRMADAEIEMIAIAVALGISQEEFCEIYEENKAELSRLRSKSELFFAVQEYMSNIKGKCIEGTVSKVYAQICNNYSGGKSALPKSPSHFSQKLSREYQAFLSAGIRINIDDTYADGTHIKIIKK